MPELRLHMVAAAEKRLVTYKKRLAVYRQGVFLRMRRGAVVFRVRAARDAEGGVPYGADRTISVTVWAGALDSPHDDMDGQRKRTDCHTSVRTGSQ